MAAYTPNTYVPTPQNVQQGQRTLWVGDLEEWMNEQWMWSVFSYGQTVTECKVIRNRTTGQCAGYGFVEFANYYEAEQVINNWNGKPIPNHPASKNFKLNWAAHGLSKDQVGGQAPGGDHAIFVGDLDFNVTDAELLTFFQTAYASVKTAKIVTCPCTGVSKGYGFVRFSDEGEKYRAIQEMNGALIATRNIRVSEAAKKDRGEGAQMGIFTAEQTKTEIPRGALAEVGMGGEKAHMTEEQAELDKTNTTLFVGGLDSTITDLVLATSAFAQFGTIVYCRCPPGKSCGFVQYNSREEAQAALDGMNGAMLGRCKLRVSWGKAGVGRGNQPIARQPQQFNYYGAAAAGWGGFPAPAYAYGGAVGGEYGASVGAHAPAVEEANVIDAPQDPITSNSLYIPAREGRFTCGFLGRTLNGVDRFHSFEPA